MMSRSDEKEGKRVVEMRSPTSSRQEVSGRFRFRGALNRPRDTGNTIPGEIFVPEKVTRAPAAHFANKKHWDDFLDPRRYDFFNPGGFPRFGPLGAVFGPRGLKNGGGTRNYPR